MSWNTSQGTTHGTVQEKHTEDFQFAGQQFRPTEGDPYYEDPYYIVESDKTDSDAAHKEPALSPRD